jgi:putative ABC transport system permease protein
VLRQAQTFGIFALVAVALASLGVLGLASAIADRRTKEVGIRKAMGAGNAEILAMLLRQFSLPILWASLIAWPISAILLTRWLETFARHVSLQPWVFIGASLLALVISLATVSVQAWRVATAKPVAALRYQ